MKEISGGRLQIGAGTLYGAISTLVEKGWIQECPDGDGGRKKEYQITHMGVEVVAAELTRLSELVANGEKVMGENQLTGGSLG